jgi:hypothetical protein
MSDPSYIFGELTATQWRGFDDQGRDSWLCVCNCGRQVNAYTDDLRLGRARACRICDPESEIVQARRYPERPKPVSPISERRLQGTGYILVRSPQGRWVPEHRLVAKKMLGRPLAEGERVYHLNGKRDDDRAENLQVRTSPPSSGLTPDELVRYAVAILERYAPERLAVASPPLIDAERSSTATEATARYSGS